MGKQFEFLKKNIGFTLTELIVTMAVSAILLSASVAGIIAWVHHADYVRNENYAETIYYAVQSELTRYRGNGQLKELADDITKDENRKVPVGDIPAIADKNKYTDRLYYLKKDAGPMDENNPLGGLLSDYIYDSSIMDGAICVEFDPADGTVYSVSYSDRNTGFTYDTSEPGISLLDRSEDTRKKNRVGYYSVDLSDAAPKAAKEKLRLERVELVNEDQLYLRWSLPERYNGVRGFLSYTIDIYQKADDEPKYSFEVNKNPENKLQEKESGHGIEEYIITCENKLAPAGEDRKYQFVAYMDESEKMYLVLDSIDYGVEPDKIEKNTLAGDPPFKTDAFRNSASVLQLFAEPEDIYIKVQAHGMAYKNSAQKQSNTSNTLFASMAEPEAGGIAKRYEIKNARHLYNIRYTEKENSGLTNPKDLVYQQTADITWLSKDEKLFHSIEDPLDASKMLMHPLEENDKCAQVSETASDTETPAEKVPYFPAISSFGERSILEAVSGRAYELKKFVLYQAGTAEAEDEATENGIAEAAETEDEEAGEAENETAYALGLVAENKGLIQNLKITGVNVQGAENVGAVCGKNSGSGKVRNTTVSGIVTGRENVGGIVGLDQAASVITPGTDITELSPEEQKNISYINLKNYARVTGSDGKVGGVVGSLGENGQAYLCENYGAVKGEETYTAYIGGITGYNEGLVQGCVSAPGDVPVEVSGKLDPAALKGIFVGGVVGCNNGGTIKDSGTEKESKKLAERGSDAYVIGYRYVGGIVGYNNGKVGDDGDRGTTGTLVVNISSTRSNKAKVIGHDYVGGIVGANGLLTSDIKKDITEDDLKDCKIVENYSDLMLVENWTNEGIVEAVGSDGDKGSYAGGIAGYNAGDLKNCTTRINTSSSGASQLLDQVRLYGTNASYVGGVAGCNIGHIYNGESENGESKTVSVNSVVSGKNYVGGIVGYNGKAANIAAGNAGNSGKIENYVLTGGYIYGESYVGGYAGLNTTENLLGRGNKLSSSPNEVKAKYFAGGVMGALILVPKNNEVIEVNCETNNFFGNVTAEEAFAGGYVGYTQLLKTGENAEVRAKALYTKLTEAGNTQELANAVLSGEERTPDIDHETAEIRFAYLGTAPGESRFESVKAPIFAGGVMGGNSWNTKLLLQNIDNKVRVTATDSVTCGFISDSENTKNGGEPQKDRFSFAGGIIGLVTPNAVIDNCGNSDAGNVDGKGTYSGGIAEVNLGTIENCTVGSVSNRSYYGGIAGLNTNGGTTNSGTIINCTLDGQISGESYLGGIVACNEGIIERCSVTNSTSGESAVIGTGSYIGGIAAVSRVKTVTVIDGKTSYSNQIKNCKVEANIGAENMGEYAGGLLGRFEGGLLSGSSVTAKDIRGADHVGGIAGVICVVLEERDPTSEEKRISNHANVTAAGAAGGIGGCLKEGAAVIRCLNDGEIRSTEGQAGGIVPEIEVGSRVEKCLNSGNVEAVGDMAGGIAAKNSGAITECSVETISVGNAFTVTGIKAIGGIAGGNWGTIASCSIKGNVAVRDVNAVGKDWKIGGIVGINTGTISDSTAEAKNNEYPKISSLSQESYLGGIAGTNKPDGIGVGTITGGAINLEVRLSTGQSGTVGGAAGANAGTISNITFLGTVNGTSGSAYGTGGIAGRNELGGTAGSISGCVLRDEGEVSAISGATGFGGQADTVKGVYVGGICGVNPENGSITECYLEGAGKVSGDYGHVGGIVAFNLGEVKNSGSRIGDTTSSPSIFDSIKTGSGRCIIGGIAGYNGASGILESCTTGKSWTITNNINSNDVSGYPTGGIIGCNKSVYDQRGLTNHAMVSGGWMSGGIIGQQSTEQRGGFTIEQCENYGTVTASHRSAGGIIGDWGSQSGRVRECINHGEVSVTNSDGYGRNAAGGIIGTGYRSTPVSITIERCGNEGKILHATGSAKNGRAAGIFGFYNTGEAALTLTITDCYNAAEIQNESSGISAGIFTQSQGNNAINLTIARCVNYGRGTDTTKATFAGIVSNGNTNGTKKVEQCLNVGECYNNGQRPIAYSTNIVGDNVNYYFSNPTVNGYTGGTTPSPTTRQVAKLQANGGSFQATDETYFDEDSDRLYLSADRNKYLQFTDVSGTYRAPGDQAAILSLKNNFSSINPRGDQYALLLFGMERGNFEAPSSVKLEETDGVYKVTYEAHPDAIFCTAGYEVEIWGVKNDGSDEKLAMSTIGDPTQNTWIITAEDLYNGNRAQYTTIRAQVRAVKKNPGYEQIIGKDGTNYSDWTSSDLLETRLKLPMPRIHFEVTADGSDEQMCGYWVLDNADDYKDYGENWKVKLEKVGIIADLSSGHVRSSRNGSGVEATYTVTGETIGSPSNRKVEAYAYDTTATYRDSDKFEKMLSWYRKDCTLKAELVDAAKKGEFIGTKAGELSYRFQLKQENSNYVYANITYMAEFWFDGEKIGESTVLLPQGHSSVYCTIDLSSVPQDKIREIIESINQGDSGKEVKICFYPWEMEDVKYYVTDDSTKEVITRTVSEAAGTNSTAFHSSYVSYSLNDLTGYKMYPAPELGNKVITITADDSSITHTLYWDANATVGNDGAITITKKTGTDYDGAEYAITVTGKTGDTEVVLYRQTVNGNSVALQENNWKYEQLILNVERLGKEAGSGNVTHYIGASSEKDYSIPIRLSSISKPSAELRDRNSMAYRVSWVKSAETGVSGYRIIMRGKKADGSAILPITVVDVEGSGVTNTEIDLDEKGLGAAKEIEFSVVVLSDTADTQHVDSRESAGVLCKIPARLSEPTERPELKLDGTTDNVPTTLEPEKFTDLMLQLTDNNASSEDATYAIEYFVTDVAVGADGALKDWEQAAGERPELDADKGIYISAEPVTMVGNLQSAYYMLNQPGDFNAEQAGRTLWYRIRAVSNSKISSVWTEWQSVELPKALLAPVTIPESRTVERECSYKIDDDNGIITMRQPKLGFTPVEFAKGYEIYIKEAEKYERNETTGKMEVTAGSGAEHTYTLEEAGTGGTPGQTLGLKEGGTEKPMVSEAGDSGETIWSCDLYTIEHSYKLTGGDTEYTYAITTAAKLCYSVKNDTVQEIWLELPEGVALDIDGSEISGGKFIATAAVDITVIEPDERYVVEKMTSWQRNPADAESITITQVGAAGHSAGISVAGYFEDTLSADGLSDQALQMFGLSRIPSASLPEKMPEEETSVEEEKPEKEEDEKKTESGAQKSGVSGNDKSAGQ